MVVSCCAVLCAVCAVLRAVLCVSFAEKLLLAVLVVVGAPCVLCFQRFFQCLCVLCVLCAVCRARGAPTEGRLRAKCRRGGAAGRKRDARRGARPLSPQISVAARRSFLLLGNVVRAAQTTGGRWRRWCLRRASNPYNSRAVCVRGPAEGRLRAVCRRGCSGDLAGASARRERSLGPKGLTRLCRVRRREVTRGLLILCPGSLRRARCAPTEGRLRAKCRRVGSAGDPAGTSARRELSQGPKGLTFPRRVWPGAGATVGGRLMVVPRCAPTPRDA